MLARRVLPLGTTDNEKVGFPDGAGWKHLPTHLPLLATSACFRHPARRGAHDRRVGGLGHAGQRVHAQAGGGNSGSAPPCPCPSPWKIFASTWDACAPILAGCPKTEGVACNRANKRRPEVQTVISQLGRPDDGTDTRASTTTNCSRRLNPMIQWRKGIHQGWPDPGYPKGIGRRLSRRGCHFLAGDFSTTCRKACPA